MSRSSSGSGKISSLAKCYDFIEEKKRSKKYAPGSSSCSRSALDCVEDKVEEALKKDPNFSNLESTAKWSTAQQSESSPVPFNGDSAHGQDCEGQGQVDTLTGQSCPTRRTESQESDVAGASAITVSSMDEAKKTFAADLVNPEKLWVFFSDIVTDYASDAIEENVKEMQLAFTHSREISQAAKRSECRFRDVCNLPLKLILTPLKRGHKVATAFASMLEMKFGPLHAALQVGSVMLEWNDSSLVTPHLCAYEDQVLQLDVQSLSRWAEYTAEQHPEMSKVAAELKYPEQIELTYQVTSKKKNLIDALIELIIEYNKHYYYNLFDRNCQHFVLDALRVLDVTIPKELPGGLGEYYKALKNGRTPSVPAQFKTHSDLDKYVMHIITSKLIDTMPQHDLEFLLALYFRFHLESKAKLKDDSKKLEEWRCGEKHCFLEEVERRIQIESMKIHSFKLKP